jgi:hypothetical protein
MVNPAAALIVFPLSRILPEVYSKEGANKAIFGVDWACVITVTYGDGIVF